MHEGLPVVVSSWLPAPAQCPASSLETRNGIQMIDPDRMVHSVKIGGTRMIRRGYSSPMLLVSQEFYDKLKNQYDE